MSDRSTVAVPRRKLRFESVGDLLAELERIEAAWKAGELRVLGNWTPSQILAHIAAWIEYGWSGYPLKPPPFFVAWILRLMLKKYLRDGMPAGVRIPKVEGGTIGQDDGPFDEALARLRRALERLQRGDPAQYPSPAFGKMTEADRIRLNLRHAELHLGFLDPQ